MQINEWNEWSFLLCLSLFKYLVVVFSLHHQVSVSYLYISFFFNAHLLLIIFPMTRRLVFAPRSLSFPRLYSGVFKSVPQVPPGIISSFTLIVVRRFHLSYPNRLFERPSRGGTSELFSQGENNFLTRWGVRLGSSPEFLRKIIVVSRFCYRNLLFFLGVNQWLG